MRYTCGGCIPQLETEENPYLCNLQPDFDGFKRWMNSTCASGRQGKYQQSEQNSKGPSVLNACNSFGNVIIILKGKLEQRIRVSTSEYLVLGDELPSKSQCTPHMFAMHSPS